MAIRAVLFDWRGTLFYEITTVEWLEAGAAAIGRTYDSAELRAMARRIEATADHPAFVAALATSDCSPELNRESSLLGLGLAGLDEDLALAVWQQDGEIGTSLPYADTEGALSALKRRGAAIAVVSDIHYELAPHFAAYGLESYVDSYILSYQFGTQKPDERLFQAALDALGVRAEEALMVGDRPARDCGGVALGIKTMILPPVANGSVRGLDAVLRLL